MNRRKIPVMGWAGERVIGHWDESSYVFTPLDEEIMESETQLHLQAYPWKPLIVDIKRMPCGKGLFTYRSFGPPTARTIICRY